MPVIGLPPQATAVVSQKETALASNAYDDPFSSLFKRISGDNKWQSRVAFERLSNAIYDLRRLSDCWDDDDAPAPSRHALDFAQAILDKMYEYDLTPTGVVPSAEGGVAVAFIKGAKYAHIEVLNTGDVLSVAYEGVSAPEVHDYEQEPMGVASAIARISDFIS